jgi:hypothetical protein
VPRLAAVFNIVPSHNASVHQKFIQLILYGQEAEFALPPASHSLPTMAAAVSLVENFAASTSRNFAYLDFQQSR